MAATLRRKARADLGRHRARTALTVFTLALAIASAATMAVPALIDRAMNDEVRAARLADVTLETDDLALTADDLAAIRDLPNVAAADARVLHATRATVGAGEHQARLWGLDLADQHVNVVNIESGEAPGPGQVLVDSGNDDAGEGARPGDVVTLTDASGAPVDLEISGTGRSLATSPGTSPDAPGEPVFYAGTSTAQQLAGARLVDQIALRLDDPGPEAAAGTVDAVRELLRPAAGGGDALAGLPEVRAPGDWPGRDLVEQITSLFQVVTVLAFGSALFLVANTMNTLIVEQRAEIAVMKAVGGRRRQIAGAFVRTALLVGAAGAVLGAVAGAGLAHLLSGFFLDMFGVAPAFAVDVPTVVGSLVLGPAAAVAATLPGLRRGLRQPVAAALDDRGVAPGFGSSRLDRFVARTRLLPGPARMGVRNVLRHKRRSAATVAQLTLAVASALALTALGSSIRATMADVYASLDYEIVVEADGGAGFGRSTLATVAATPGVGVVSPVLYDEVEHEGTRMPAVGIGESGRYRPVLSDGRWFTDEEAVRGAHVAVLGPAAARSTGSTVGDTLRIDTATGPRRVEVVGIDTVNFNMGQAVFLPRTTLAEATGAGPDASNELWVTVDGSGTAAASATEAGARGSDVATIDAVALAVDDRLRDAGFALDVERNHVRAADEKADLEAVIGVQRLMGLLIVAVSLLGLVNAITMSVIERTREIGVLRCLGARGRDIRRGFTAESLVLVAVGWLVGVPAGWVLLQGLRSLATSLTDMDLPSVYPLVNAPIVLAGTVVLALSALALPRRRAARMRPATALRYQ